MKLLTILAAFLLSFPAVSQDIIEYNQGTFSRNGEELSIEQISSLTKQIKGRRYAQKLLFKGKRANKMANNRLHRNSIAIITAGIGGFYSAGSFAAGDLAKDFDLGMLQKAFYGLGVVMIPSTALLAINISRQEFWINQRDDAFIRLAERLNKAAIQSEQ
ncbi:MAG: hypothetical protein ACON5F_04760 [Jejuia sp.]